MGVSNTARREGSLPRQAGFTLIEVIIAVAIIGIAVAIAIPNFGRMYTDYQAKTTAAEITRFLVMTQTRAQTSNQTLTVGIVLVSGVVSMTTTNPAGVQVFRNGFDAVHMTALTFNSGAIPGGGVVMFSSDGMRTSAPGVGVQTITVVGTAGADPTRQYRVNIGLGGITRLVML